MSETDTADRAVRADLASPRFRAGVMRGHWKELSYAFPILVTAVAGVEPDRTASTYSFRFELTAFPATAPEVRIWDTENNLSLAPERRPKGSQRVVEAFKDWGHGVYRPWERNARAHNNWAGNYPDLAWHAARDLAFILEDLHGLLTSNAASRCKR